MRQLRKANSCVCVAQGGLLTLVFLMSEEPEAQGELEFFIATLTFGVLLILCVLCRIPDAKQAPKMPQNLRKQKTRKKLDSLTEAVVDEDLGI